MSKVKDIEDIKARFQSGDYIPFPLKNVILEYPHLDTPDDHFDPGGGKYKVNCIVTSDVADDMIECGINVKTRDDGERYIQPSRKPELGKPVCVDTDGNPVDPRTIGNGSVASLDLKTKFWKIAGKAHQTVYIEKIVIEDLVKFEGATGDPVDPFSA